MNILPTVNNFDKNRNIRFKAVPQTINQTGILKQNTRSQVTSIVGAYKDIMNKLSKITDEGLEEIKNGFPNVSVIEHLVFHNCGENNSSIAIKCAVSGVYSSLTKIIRRQGNTEWSKRITQESFLLDTNAHLLKDFDTNRVRQFPESREYYTQEEINGSDMEENLIKTLSDLEVRMLEFRKYLLKLGDMYVKVPDGQIPRNVVDKFDKIKQLKEKTDSMAEKLPHKQALAMKNRFETLNLSARSSYPVFKDLGDEQVSVYFAPVESSRDEILHRMMVYDKNHQLKNVYLIAGKEKFVSNLNVNEPTLLPPKFKYYSQDDLKDILPIFEKYLNLYNAELEKYYDNCADFYKNYNAKFERGILAEDVSNGLKELSYFYDSVKSVRKRLCSDDDRIVAQSVNLISAKQYSNVEFEDKVRHKTIGYMPVSANNTSNLVKICIKDTETNQENYYLIHNFKSVVKNFNPKYPNVIPPVLTYLSNEDVEKLDLMPSIDFLIDSLKKYAEVAKNMEKSDVDSEVLKNTSNKSRNREVKAPKSKQQNSYKTLASECVANLKQAFKNAESDFETGFSDVEKAVSDIQKRILEYYEKMTNNK